MTDFGVRIQSLDLNDNRCRREIVSEASQKPVDFENGWPKPTGVSLFYFSFFFVAFLSNQYLGGMLCAYHVQHIAAVRMLLECHRATAGARPASNASA